MNIGKESETLEFKLTTGELHQGIESIAAILNKHGYGELFFGVADSGEVKGQPVTDATIRTVTDGILRDIEPRITPEVKEYSYDGRSTVKVTFSGTQRPYSAFGRFLIRVGTQNRQMTRDELRKLIKDEDYSHPWEDDPSDYGVADLDDDAMRRYFHEAVSCGRLVMEEYDKDALLSALELKKGNGIKNAAWALFGKECGVGLKLATFATDEKMTFLDLTDKKGNIYSLIGEAVNYVMSHINWRAEIERKRIEVPEIPIEAVREIVVNAFAHAIYKPLPEIEIDVHPGMVCIFNPGSFPDDLTPEDFISRNISSKKRNPLILDVLYRCKDVEKSGTGFRRMNKMCSAEGVRWEFEKTPYGFYFRFLRKPVSLNVSLNVSLAEGLSEEEKAVLLMIKGNHKISKTEMAERLSKSTRSIQRVTSSLVVKGRLIRVGNNRYGYWEVMEK